MKRILKIVSIGALVCALGGFGSGCDVVFDPLVPDEPYEVRDIKMKAGINDDDFCRYVGIENIHKTIPVVNRYINNLPGNLDAGQRAKALVALFKSFAGVIGTRLIQDEYMGTPAVFFSFMDGQTERELGLDFSSTGKVLSYHYDITTGVFAKVYKGVPIDKVFDMINSLDFEVKEVMYGTLVSSWPSSEENLQKILDALNAKAYTHESDVWFTSGYLSYQTGEITIFPHLVRMNNKAYQADWLVAMREYGLTGSPDGTGYAVEFLIPEDATIPASHWTKMFEKFRILEVAELYYNRYTLADETIGGGHEEGVAAVDSKIHIRPVETYALSPRTFQLQCVTERQYGSGSNPIIFVKQQSGNTIDISFKGVAEIGMTANIGPARAYIDLGALTEGVYTLNLHNGDIKQAGTLLVADESYTIEMDDNPTFAFSPKQLNRIPEHTIWGLVGYHEEGTALIVEKFFSDLVALGVVKKPFSPGDYGEFLIDGNGDIAHRPGVLHGYKFDRHFIFSYSGGLSKIDRLVEQYARDHKDDMYITVYTDQGEQSLSWVYD